MTRRKATVVLPQPATLVLRRSARLNSRQDRDGQGISGKDLVLNSAPPSKSRRKLLGLQVNLFGSSTKKSPSIEGFPSLRRSLRVSSRECSDANIEKLFTKPKSTSASRIKSINVSSSCTVRRSPRFSSGGASVDQSTSASRMKSINASSSCTLRRSPRFSSRGVSVDQSSSSSNGRKSSGKSVLSRCSTKSISSEIGKDGDGVKSRDRSRIRVCPKTKQLSRGYDDEEEEEVNVCLSESNRVKIAKPNEEENAVPKADKGKSIETEEEEGLKTKNKIEKEWTEELELSLQGAYLTVKPSPNFWKKVAKMVPGKSAQECFDRVNSALITPRQLQPRKARKTNLSTIPQFSLSASKLLKPNSPKIKIRQRRNHLSKKTVRHLLEKQNHMDQGLGFDLFSVLEPNTSSNLISTPTENGKSLPKILESPVPLSRFASEDQTTLISPPVLKQVKNKALHEKYIDHLHIREAKRQAESTRLAGKENIRPIDIQKKDLVKAAKDALYFDVEDAIQKLKGLEAENSSSSSEFCYDNGETDEEDESI
ncbi:hypothetical protein V5N11_027690 [Cardamine amara subsp. amara]|uniref:Myb-like domain-containing protein n=1 Tax=Cardamine amara subsp. amara TaxID=228776 RepID=A0ABD0ZMD9_CARAN